MVEAEVTKEDGIEIDVENIREQARQQLDQGAVTSSLGRDPAAIAMTLNKALATELVCTLRYLQNAIIAEELGAEVVAREFREHADQEFRHAGRLAKRISLLGGTPDFQPSTLEDRSHADYVGFSADDDNVLAAMLEENLVAERIAVAVYHEIIKRLGDDDPTTRRLMEEILEEEEKHADELAALLSAVRELRNRLPRPAM